MSPGPGWAGVPAGVYPSGMASSRLEGFWARLAGDPAAREAFLADPVGEATRAGLTPEEVACAAAVDREAMALEARRLARSRAAPGAAPEPGAPRGVRRLVFGLVLLGVCAGIGLLWSGVVRVLAGVVPGG